LHVSGNQILNGSGQPVRLRGVNRTSGEYACIQNWGIFEGSTSDTAIQAMLSWKINAVRVPLNEDCWLDVNTGGISRAYVGATYRNTVVDYVNRLTAAGIVVILDLHWAAPGTQQATDQIPMADRDHAPAFWSSVAGTFKNNTAVVFDLFNEPYPDDNRDTTAAWLCVRDGTATAGSCPGVGYAAAGMQELLNAVRAAGATNLVMTAGVAYTGVLSHWMDYRPTDALNPPNIAASVHIYPPGSQCSTVSCWDQYLAPIAARFPIIAGETGQTGCAHDRLDTVVNWFESKQQHYLVWAWWTEPCASSAWYGLITNYDTGAPSSGYGQGYKDRLATLVTGGGGGGGGGGGTPSFTTGASVSPGSVAPGGTVNVTASVTSATALSAVVDVEIHDAADNQVYQWYDENVTFAAGQTRTFPVSWAVRANAETGTYVVQVGVFSTGWQGQYGYNSDATHISVTTSTGPGPTSTFTPTPTSTASPTPTQTPTPTTVPPPICSPRPPVRVSTQAVGSGRLQVTLASQTNPSSAPNTLQQMTLGALRNARVTANGAALAPGASVSLGGVQTTTFTVTRTSSGQATFVPFTVYDRCGPWTTFVGGGPGAF
jgi:hypothetical protein